MRQETPEGRGPSRRTVPRLHVVSSPDAPEITNLPEEVRAGEGRPARPRILKDQTVLHRSGPPRARRRGRRDPARGHGGAGVLH